MLIALIMPDLSVGVAGGIKQVMKTNHCEPWEWTWNRRDLGIGLLAHCSPMMYMCLSLLGHHWFRQWLGHIQCQSITWSNDDKFQMDKLTWRKFQTKYSFFLNKCTWKCCHKMTATVFIPQSVKYSFIPQKQWHSWTDCTNNLTTGT